ncbi:hypothetical protein HPB52_021079 [Rhipicephalus sanguineus]|uniref:Tick transposon n=1 Tax=Rhipicephalus sanguineus TaxID=34632 RepID=A0A9D4T4B0_RHISA|nr:hypothetical protein HPB52_021079 [Rhipicephalus sanguineus]
MACPIPPPLFLSTPGDPPIPWADWKLIFQAYADAAGEDAAKPERRKALFINALGRAGLKRYQTEFRQRVKRRLRRLTYSKPHSHCSTIILKTQSRQLPGQPVVDFIASLRSLAASCGFGALENDMIRPQLFIGVASQNVRCRLLQKGSSITLSEALSIAREDGLVRVQLEQFAPHSVQQLSAAGGAMAPVLCFTGRANMAALLRLGAAVNMAARLHSPFVAVNMAAPPRPGVEEAVNMATPCCRIQLFRINTEL